MSKYGLLGEHLGHSYSPQIHKILGGYDYQLFEKAPEELKDFLLNGDFDGINVTIPYKMAVIPYCSELSPAAERIGSVNTIIKRADGSLYGDNTDYYGFCELAKKTGAEISGKAVILGNGGVSPTVRAALEAMGAEEVITVSRKGEDNYDNLDRHYDAKVIVNATPVGMFPNNGQTLVELERFTECGCVLDVIYNPLRTKLVLDAEALGIKAAGGLYMLVAQAARACELFIGKKIDEAQIDAVYNKLSTDMQNIVLIGMPGCGKSTSGYQLQKKTGRELIDIDKEIVARAGMSIPEYFEKFGVDGFRKLETEVVRDIGKLSGKIIATGGGVITREENYNLLHQNGIIVFLERDIENLPTNGRPLSQANPLSKLAEERMPLYNKWCDYKIKGESPYDAAEKILEALK